MARPVFVAGASGSARFVSSTSVTLTTGANANRAVWGFVWANDRSGGGSTNITGVTVGGNAATLTSAVQFTGISPAMYGKAFSIAGDANVPSGSASVVASFDDANSSVGLVVMSFDTAAAAPFGTATWAQSLANSAATWTLTSTANALVVAGAMTYPMGTTAWTAVSPATQGASLDSSYHTATAVYRDGAAGSTTIATNKNTPGPAAGWFGVAVSIEGSAPPTDLSGNVDLGSVAPGGGFGSSASDLSGNVDLGSIAPGGGFGVTPGTINLSLRNANGGTWPLTAVPWLNFARLTDGVQVLSLNNRVTDAASALSINNAALVPGQWYAVSAFHTDGTKMGIWIKQAA